MGRKKSLVGFAGRGWKSEFCLWTRTAALGGGQHLVTRQKIEDNDVKVRVTIEEIPITERGGR
jgi:hypothetical protein